MGSSEAKAKWPQASRPPSFIPSSSKSDSEETLVDIKWWPYSYQQHKEKSTDVRMQEFEGDTLQKKLRIPDFDPYELEPEMFGMNKNEPWWRKADLDDLASFVLLKSHEHFDKCDMPLPRTNKTEWLVCDKEKATSRKLSKAQLLEASCHSERRAREAEKACNEKEHVVSLFLKQVSQMFAYKQWLHILHLETLCLQLRGKKYGKVPKRVQKKNKSVGELVLGLALAGAGVLLGWTLGWLFHAL